MEITLASSVREPTLSPKVCSSVRLPVGSHDWLSNRGQSDCPSYNGTARHDTWHMDTNRHRAIVLVLAKETRGNLDLQPSASSLISPPSIVMVTNGFLYHSIPFDLVEEWLNQTQCHRSQHFDVFLFALLKAIVSQIKIQLYEKHVRVLSESWPNYSYYHFFSFFLFRL
jgi:hypothetical protein